MNLNPLRRAQAAGLGLHVVTFNVWVGQKPAQLKENLEKLTKALGMPHIVILEEAWRWRKGSIKGYVPVRPHQDKYDTDKSTMILVRKDGRIIKKGSRRVKGGGWTWNGNDKAARVFPWVVVQFPVLGRRVWDVIGVHRVPNGPDPHIQKNAVAWAREHEMLIRWVRRLHKRHPDRVIVLGGDWNSRLGTEPQHQASLMNFRHDLPNPTEDAFRGIDGFFAVNAEFKQITELEHRFGSDAHNPVSSHVYQLLEEAA